MCCIEKGTAANLRSYFSFQGRVSSPQYQCTFFGWLGGWVGGWTTKGFGHVHHWDGDGTVVEGAEHICRDLVPKPLHIHRMQISRTVPLVMVRCLKHFQAGTSTKADFMLGHRANGDSRHHPPAAIAASNNAKSPQGLLGTHGKEAESSTVIECLHPPALPMPLQRRSLLATWDTAPCDTMEKQIDFILAPHHKAPRHSPRPVLRGGRAAPDPIAAVHLAHLRQNFNARAETWAWSPHSSASEAQRQGEIRTFRAAEQRLLAQFTARSRKRRAGPCTSAQ